MRGFFVEIPNSNGENTNNGIQGQRYRINEEGFEVKGFNSEELTLQKSHCIHPDPVKGKCQLSADYTQ